MNTFWLYLITIPVLGVFDFLWIGIVAQRFYKSQLGSLLSSNIIWWAAILFYLLYAAGLVFFVIAPSVQQHSLMRALFAGLFFGLVAFGTYDLTNLSTTTGWPLIVSVVDMAWGTFAGGAVSIIVYFIATNVIGL